MSSVSRLRSALSAALLLTIGALDSDTRTPWERSQSQLSLAAPTGSASGLNVVRLQLETPRCVPATARSPAAPARTCTLALHVDTRARQLGLAGLLPQAPTGWLS